MKKFRFGFLVLFITLSAFASDKTDFLFVENVEADCAFSPVQAEYKRSKAVFVGKVINVVEKGDSKIYEFRVSKYWKGVKGKKIKITTGDTMRFEPNYQMGKSYLIYAYAGDGTLRTGKCSRGSQVEYAKEDLKLLGKGKTVR